jgi:hypothetical protein
VIPIIGFIVAAYTIPRLLSLGARSSEHVLTRIVAALGLLATIVLCLALLSSGSSTPHL